MYEHFEQSRQQAKRLGGKIRDEPSSEDGGAMSEDSWEGQMTQHDQFWAAEVDMRGRTALLTKKEKEMLMERADAYKERKDMLNDPLNHPRTIGLCTAWVHDMLEQDTHGCAEMYLGPGQVVPTSKTMWSLLKLVMLCEHEVEKPKGHKPKEADVCHCLDATWFMPYGCSHGPNGVDGHIMGGMKMELCNQCSKCIRCGGFPGFLSVTTGGVAGGRVGGCECLGAICSPWCSTLRLCKRVKPVPAGLYHCNCMAEDLDGSFAH